MLPIELSHLDLHTGRCGNCLCLELVKAILAVCYLSGRFNKLRVVKTYHGHKMKTFDFKMDESEMQYIYVLCKLIQEHMKSSLS